MTDLTNQSDPTEIDLRALQTALEREANSRIAANAKDEAKPKAFLICDLGILSSNSSLNSTIRFLSDFDLTTSAARIVQRSAST